MDAVVDTAEIEHRVLGESRAEQVLIAEVDSFDHGLGEFAGRTFDYYGQHPELARLLQWEGLRGAPPVNAVARVAHYGRQVAAAAQAQRDGAIDSRIDAGHLMFMIIGLAAWWFSVPQLAAMLTGADADAPSEQAKRRAFVVEAAQRLTCAQPVAQALPLRSPARHCSTADRVIR